MKNYFKLVNFELNRFMKIYLALTAIVVLSQLIGTVLMARSFVGNFNEKVYIEGYSIEQFLDQFGSISLFELQHHGSFILPIVFAAATLILYCFFIWYRDWFGKNTFIYRLLMLPTARINLYFSKATAIFLMVLGLVALQVFLLQIEGMLLKWIVPANLRTDFSIMEIQGIPHLGLLIPNSFVEFIIHYGLGFMAVFVLFTSILFERSFRFIGVLYGVLYAMFAAILFYSPYIVMSVLGKNVLYPNELFGLQVILWVIVTAMSIWISNYLLNKKVSV